MGLKVEISLKIEMVFISFVNFRVSQKSEQIELYLLPPLRAAL